MSESRHDRQAYLGVGIAFLPLAVALWIAMDSWVVAVPFAAIAVTFLILGAKSSPPSKSEGDDVG